MRTAEEAAARQQHGVVDLVHKLNPLDPAALKLVRQLFDSECPSTAQLFGDLRELVNQTLSIPVQECAFELLKRLVAKPIAEFTTDAIVDFMTPLFENHPFYFIALLKLVVDKVSVEQTIEKFFALPKFHGSSELFQCVLAPHAKSVSPELVVKIFYFLDQVNRIPFFRFMMQTFGPLPELLKPALSHLHFITQFIRELSRTSIEDFNQKNAVLKIPDVNDRNRHHSFDLLVCVLSDEATGKVSNETARIILAFIIQNCLRLQETSQLLQYLDICSRDEVIRPQISKFDVWNHIIAGFDTDCDLALKLVKAIPVPNFEIGNYLVQCLFYVFAQNERTERIATTLASVLRQSDDHPVGEIIPVLKMGLNSVDPYLCLIVAIGLGPKGFAQLVDANFWQMLTVHVEREDWKAIPVIAQLGGRIFDFVPDVPWSPEFFGALLKTLYVPGTKFELCREIIEFLARAGSKRHILAFLQKRHFGKYLAQLPWRYTEDVSETLESCAIIFAQHYPVVNQI
jgi:hypothetical protein